MTRGITITVKAITEGFDVALREKYRPLAEAGQETIIEIANAIKNAGRAEIAAAGFSARWQNALRADVYPKRKVSLNAATLVFHKIPYADVLKPVPRSEASRHCGFRCLRRLRNLGAIR